jgi:hypothetical protein
MSSPHATTLDRYRYMVDTHAGETHTTHQNTSHLMKREATSAVIMSSVQCPVSSIPNVGETTRNKITLVKLYRGTNTHATQRNTDTTIVTFVAVQDSVTVSLRAASRKIRTRTRDRIGDFWEIAKSGASRGESFISLAC